MLFERRYVTRIVRLTIVFLPPIVPSLVTMIGHTVSKTIITIFFSDSFISDKIFRVVNSTVESGSPRQRNKIMSHSNGF